MRRYRSLIPASLLTFALIGVAGCSSDSDGGSGSASGGTADTEQILETLDCTKMAEGQQQVSDAVMYDCAKADGYPVYVLTFESAEKLDGWVEEKKGSRASTSPPRGLAKGDGWVVDTMSKTAIDTAADNGAEVIVAPE